MRYISSSMYLITACKMSVSGINENTTWYQWCSISTVSSLWLLEYQFKRVCATKVYIWSRGIIYKGGNWSFLVQANNMEWNNWYSWHGISSTGQKLIEWLKKIDNNSNDRWQDGPRLLDFRFLSMFNAREKNNRWKWWKKTVSTEVVRATVIIINLNRNLKTVRPHLLNYWGHTVFRF